MGTASQFANSAGTCRRFASSLRRRDLVVPVCVRSRLPSVTPRARRPHLGTLVFVSAILCRARWISLYVVVSTALAGTAFAQAPSPAEPSSPYTVRLGVDLGVILAAAAGGVVIQVGQPSWVT